MTSNIDEMSKGFFSFMLTSESQDRDDSDLHSFCWKRIGLWLELLQGSLSRCVCLCGLDFCLHFLLLKFLIQFYGNSSRKGNKSQEVVVMVQAS